MLAKDLILLLEEKIKEHEPMLEMMGELKIVVDRFEKVGSKGSNGFGYKGWDPGINLEFDSTTGHFIISAFAEESPTKR